MMQIVAVVDAAAHTVIVWHVDVGTEVPGMSRMCGAWVVTEPRKVELLTRGRLVVATVAGAAAMRSAGCTPAGALDLVQTVKSVVAERDRLQAIYDALPASRKKNLVVPRWPHIPDTIDPTSPPRTEGADNAVAVALSVARYLDELAAAWTAIERQRIARTYLTDNTPGRPSEARALPLEVIFDDAICPDSTTA